MSPRISVTVEPRDGVDGAFIVARIDGEMVACVPSMGDPHRVRDMLESALLAASHVGRQEAADRLWGQPPLGEDMYCGRPDPGRPDTDYERMVARQEEDMWQRAIDWRRRDD